SSIPDPLEQSKRKELSLPPAGRVVLVVLSVGSRDPLQPAFRTRCAAAPGEWGGSQWPARAARARSWHSSMVRRDRASRTAGTQMGAMDRLVTPSPARIGASLGSPAASP